MDKFNIPKLKGRSNWTVWKLQITSALQYHDFEGILSGKIEEPPPLANVASNSAKKEYEANLKAYKKENEFAVTLISTKVEEEPLKLILMFAQ